MSETSGKIWPCPHIFKDKSASSLEEKWFYHDAILSMKAFKMPVPDEWKICPNCLVKRPEEKDELEEIFQSHGLNLSGWLSHEKESLKNDLRAWKKKAIAGFILV